MSTVIVNDAGGKFQSKFVAGETVEQARRRLECNGIVGILENSDGVMLKDDDLITEEGAPYVVKSITNQASEENRDVMAFVRSEMEDRTKNKEMSKASKDWAEAILAAYRIKHDRVKKVVDAVGSFKDPPSYEWTIQTQEGEVWNMGKHGGTLGALEWLKENFLPTDSPYNLKVVTGAKLPKVKGNRKSATGKTDVLIGLATDINKGSTFDFAMGIVELKTNNYPLKVGQNLLELLALSTASSFQKAVTLLATDCTTKWELFYFSDAATITSKVYDHSSKAWDDFLQLLNSIDERDYVGKDGLWISSLPQVAEQDLEGFDISERDKKKAKAEEEESMLEHFADRMGEIYGERPTVPWWARSGAKIPDYYA